MYDECILSGYVKMRLAEKKKLFPHSLTHTHIHTETFYSTSQTC